MTAPLLEVRDLVQEFPVRGAGGVRGGVVHAVSHVSFDVRAGETLGVVGETGSGKSTLARSIVQAPRPKSGTVTFRGTDLVGLRHRDLVAAQRHQQMVFQDPFGSLDPRWRVAELVEEPLVGYGMRRAARSGCGSCSSSSGWPRTCSGVAARTSCPVGSANASPSPGPSRWTRRW